MAVRYFTLKNLGLSFYLSQLPVKPLPILVLSPDCTFLVAPALALGRHDRWVSIAEGILEFSILCLDFPNKPLVLVMQK